MRKVEEADGVDVGHGDTGVLDLGRLAAAHHENTRRKKMIKLLILKPSWHLSFTHYELFTAWINWEMN